MANQKSKSTRGVSNDSRRNKKAFKRSPKVPLTAKEDDDPTLKGRGGYSFQGRHPEKAAAWSVGAARAKRRNGAAHRKEVRVKRASMVPNRAR
jgi:hypothetical protein